MDLLSDVSKSGTNTRHEPFLRHPEIESLLLDGSSLHSLKNLQAIKWTFFPPLSKTLRGFLYGAPPGPLQRNHKSGPMEPFSAVSEVKIRSANKIPAAPLKYTPCQLMSPSLHSKKLNEDFMGLSFHAVKHFKLSPWNSARASL